MKIVLRHSDFNYSSFIKRYSGEQTKEETAGHSKNEQCWEILVDQLELKMPRVTFLCSTITTQKLKEEKSAECYEFAWLTVSIVVVSCTRSTKIRVKDMDKSSN
jgi:hypothetical protein